MGIQYTTNYGIAYLDDLTPLTDLDTVTQQVALSLDGAMGRAGYTPPDATTFAALAARVTALEAKKQVRDAGRAAANFANVAVVTGTVTFATAISPAPTVLVMTPELPAGSNVDLIEELVGPVTSTGFTWRLRERSSTAVTVNAFVNWAVLR
jgi:hypothetical protein